LPSGTPVTHTYKPENPGYGSQVLAGDAAENPAGRQHDVRRADCISWCRNPTGRTGCRWRNFYGRDSCNGAPPAARKLPATLADPCELVKRECPRVRRPVWEPVRKHCAQGDDVRKSAWATLPFCSIHNIVQE